MFLNMSFEARDSELNGEDNYMIFYEVSYLFLFVIDIFYFCIMCILAFFISIY
jgi:hypothetical protein